MSQKLKANLCRNMQTLTGLWQTSEGFTLAPCNQMIQQEQTTGCLLFAVVYLQIKTAFPIRPHLMRIKKIPADFPSKSDPVSLYLAVNPRPPHVFVAIYQAETQSVTPVTVLMCGWRCSLWRQDVCLGFSLPLPPRWSSACCRPEQHFKSQQAAHSTTVSQFYHRAQLQGNEVHLLKYCT